MRLLNTQSLHFKEFLGEDVPPYAILSHVWSVQELRYEDFLAGQGKDLYGYEKIVKLRELAWSFNKDAYAKPLEYCWIDTTCIDKRSSAELTEAINSMYSWYERAKVCFVFLPDVERLNSANIDKASNVKGVPFYEYQFLEMIGQKGVNGHDARPLTDLIEKASGIGISSLLGRLHNNPRGACVAQKMSWAAKRQTTRPEDIAYCLLGIFEVNMPLLYGEGARNAYRRLQEAIIARSTDDSIFAWETDDAAQPWSGLLAPHPRVFWNCNDMYTVRDEGPKIASTYTITQRGLELVMPMEKRLQPDSTATWCTLYSLSCFRLRKPWFNCYLKVWVEGVTMDGRRYADGYRLAWRSGVITLEYEDPGFEDPRGPFKANAELKAMRQALGWETPTLLHFNDMELELYKLTLRGRHMNDKAEGVTLERRLEEPSRPVKRSLRRSISALFGTKPSIEGDTRAPSEELALVKVYFKTHFTAGETPIATALLRRPTRDWLLTTQRF